MENIIGKVGRWFFEANQQPESPQPSASQTAFYLGMQCEELAEKLKALGLHGDAAYLEHLGGVFKGGSYTKLVETQLADPDCAESLLDADADMLWVTIGAARAQGANFEGAFSAVDAANWNKRFPDGLFHNDPDTGKVLKPEGWVAPDLAPFLHPDIRKGGWKEANNG